MKRLEGKVAIITGSGGGTSADTAGVGDATARLFAKEGAQVAILDKDGEAAARTLHAVQEEGGAGRVLVADVTAESECEGAIREAVDQLGAIDILVNCAAIFGSNIPGITGIASEEWDQIMAINVKGPFLMAKHAVPHMNPGGAIVNVSSGSSLRADRTNGAYVASKGSLNALTLSLAAECGDRGIRVNAVIPSGFWGAMAARVIQLPEAELQALRKRKAEATLLKIEGTAWDIANAILFLATDESRWITGHFLEVDGGARVSATERPGVE